MGDWSNGFPEAPEHDPDHTYLREQNSRGDFTATVRCDRCGATAPASRKDDIGGCPGEPDPVSPYRLAELKPGTRVVVNPVVRSYVRNGERVTEKATMPTVYGTVVSADAGQVVIDPTDRSYGWPGLSVQTGGPVGPFTVTKDDLQHATGGPWHSMDGWNLG